MLLHQNMSKLKNLHLYIAEDLQDFPPPHIIFVIMLKGMKSTTVKV